MSVIKHTRPVYERLVQVSKIAELDVQTRFFLEGHATRPLEEISVEDTNDFLRQCYYNYAPAENVLEYA